jgi:sugar phosphate permease
MQGNYLGQVIGPLVLSAIVAYAGWTAPAGLLLAAAALATTLALLLKTGRR